MAQGVKLVRLSEGAVLVSVSVCEGAEGEVPAAISADDILNAVSKGEAASSPLEQNDNSLNKGEAASSPLGQNDNSTTNEGETK